MKRLAHWIDQWRTLPREERAVRTQAVVDRLARRNLRVRALGLVSDSPPWSRVQRELTVPLERFPDILRDDDERRGPLFADLAPRAAEIARRRPDHVRHLLEQARRVLDNRFDLLGQPVAVRPDGGLDWHRDPTSGRDWPAVPYFIDVVTVRGDGSDVKYPWELSRCQHLLTLAQVWWFARVAERDRSAAELGPRCAERIAIDLRDWIRHNPRGVGVNWTCTMEVAIRAYVWIATIALVRGAPELDDDLWRELVRSLWVHGRHIRANLEIGVDGLTSNHFLSDVVGLFAIACALPELRESREWHRFAHDAIEREIARQTHLDGVDFERSIPYHRLVTELFLHAALLAGRSGRPFSPGFDGRLSRMLDFTVAYTRPDGTAPQWGDNDDGRLLPLEGWAAAMPHDHRHLLGIGACCLGRDDLRRRGAGREVESLWLGGSAPEDRSAPVSPVSRSFESAAVFVMAGRDIHVVVGCGSVGTCGVGNHTHNDLMAPCIWAAGAEWVTDPGSGSYTGQPDLRNALRGTAAHATLQLGTREQNPFGTEVEQLFRVEERARPEVLEWETDDSRTVLRATHRGFCEGDRIWAHERELVLRVEGTSLRIHDRLELVEGEPLSEEDEVTLRFPLAPGVETLDLRASMRPEDERAIEDLEGRSSARDEARERRCVALRDRQGREAWIALGLPREAVVRTVPVDYSPAYGVVESVRRLEIQLGPAHSGLETVAIFRWFPVPRR